MLRPLVLGQTMVYGCYWVMKNMAGKPPRGNGKTPDSMKIYGKILKLLDFACVFARDQIRQTP